MTITREFVKGLPKGSKKRHYEYILNDMMRNDEWAMKAFKNVGVLLTSHPGNRPFLKASLIFLPKTKQIDILLLIYSAGRN